MNTGIKILAAGLVAFVLGLGVNNVVLSEVTPTFKVAVVDVPEVVSSSSQVQALKKEQQTKAQEIIKYIEKARKDIASTTDEKKKKSLEEKYNKELLTKREAIEKDYSNKLKSIDANISAKIAENAKANNYNIVLAKGLVLYGGDDITQDIIKAVK